ncbi:MAG: hypothetical protein CM15mP21_5200 [Hyphomicrobiales bacterium]|nr:MAG: hypothetical protein CM15mP21_5200 [Hyphomicrobiales bacterium]
MPRTFDVDDLSAEQLQKHCGGFFNGQDNLVVWLLIGDLAGLRGEAARGAKFSPIIRVLIPKGRAKLMFRGPLSCRRH